MHISVDDPAAPDPLGASPCHGFEVSPRIFGGDTFDGGGPFGGGSGGGFENLQVAPEEEILEEVLSSVLIFLAYGGPLGAGMQKHTKFSGGRLAIAKIA